MRNTFTFTGLSSEGRIQFKAESSLNIMGLSFYYGKRAWDDMGGGKNTFLKIHSVNLYHLKKKLSAKPAKNPDLLEKLLYRPERLS